ncbi:thymidylate synthase [Shigella flexneri]|uniref:Thymidylate synthase n=2 Tax=Tequatrovirus zeezee23 TaxID=2843957 RepID=A0A6B9WJW4_9CAUD|nr:thymidylate synthase [Citrobacter phage PhiZZ23]EFW8532209.1 thymidylate synthase [Shigella flexneri]EFY5479616.1 thymidylate synthase [Shigella sonnei]QHR63719.1 dTMP thymidylate synthase [Escherichia phage teqhal]QXV79056.1 thymidylate synthase [Escherichia phage FriedrichZschokke]QXV84804.1 thymidylate synthase [Escherichia phage TadeuszReichstein]QZI79421.1 thymidylate synthase [Escherichia phage vB_EcoM-101117BS1]UGO55577.1 putative thymidylate synthase [Escherichia phage JLBYU24]
MKQYQDLIKDIFENGYETDDRTGTGTIALFGTKLRWDLTKGFPAVTTKKLAWNACIAELIWFLSGSTNVNDLRLIQHDSLIQGKTVWDENYENQAKDLGYHSGELGPIYGKQWRDFGGVDQIIEVVDRIKKLPNDRRQIVSAWNPAELKYMALPPCHMFYQFNVRNGYLDLQWYQRSVDVFLGLPFNIASYATLVHIVAKMCNLIPGDLIFSGGNTHIYMNHVEQCKEILRREPMDLCELQLKFPDEFDEWDTESQVFWLSQFAKPHNFVLNNYVSHLPIKGKMAV